MAHHTPSRKIKDDESRINRGNEDRASTSPHSCPMGVGNPSMGARIREDAYRAFRRIQESLRNTKTHRPLTNTNSTDRDRTSIRGRSQSGTVGVAGVRWIPSGNGNISPLSGLPSHHRKHCSALSRVKTALCQYFLSDRSLKRINCFLSRCDAAYRGSHARRSSSTCLSPP